MIKFLLLFILSGIWISSALAESGNFDHAAKKYLMTLKNTHTRIFAGSCKTSDGVAIAIFPLRHSQGMLLEVENDSVVDLAPIRTEGKAVSLDITNAQGGICT